MARESILTGANGVLNSIAAILPKKQPPPPQMFSNPLNPQETTMSYLKTTSRNDMSVAPDLEHLKDFEKQKFSGGDSLNLSRFMNIKPTTTLPAPGRWIRKNTKTFSNSETAQKPPPSSDRNRAHYYSGETDATILTGPFFEPLTIGGGIETIIKHMT